MRTRDYLSDLLLGTNYASAEGLAKRQYGFDRLFIDGMSYEDALAATEKAMPTTKTDKVVSKLGGYLDDAAAQTHRGMRDAAASIPYGKGGAIASRMAASGVGKTVAKALPILGAATAVTDAGDIVFGQDSAANKIMDGTAMAIGGTIGGVLGMGNPLLAAAGASTGKFASDSLQWLFGDKKTAEQRKMEEALAALQGRYI